MIPRLTVLRTKNPHESSTYAGSWGFPFLRVCIINGISQRLCGYWGVKRPGGHLCCDVINMMGIINFFAIRLAGGDICVMM